MSSARERRTPSLASVDLLFCCFVSIFLQFVISVSNNSEGSGYASEYAIVSLRCRFDSRPESPVLRLNESLVVPPHSSPKGVLCSTSLDRVGASWVQSYTVTIHPVSRGFHFRWEYPKSQPVAVELEVVGPSAKVRHELTEAQLSGLRSLSFSLGVGQVYSVPRVGR